MWVPLVWDIKLIGTGDKIHRGGERKLGENVCLFVLSYIFFTCLGLFRKFGHAVVGI